MTTRQADILQYEIDLLKEERRIKARTSLKRFVPFTFEGYSMQWFHKIVCEYLDKLSKREIKKLMIFMPPQHGKTELSSRQFPAYLLGKDPKEKIIIGSYNQTKASEFVVDCKRIIKGKKYKELFPDTIINGKDTDIFFEVNNGSGFVKGAGMDSGVTGTTATCTIIDDPFKGRNEANSLTIRNRTWGAWVDDFCTRIDNEGIQLMLFTRWHEDDPAGRIIDPNNPFYDKEVAKDWTVIVFQALKERNSPIDCAIKIKDPRKVGEALWQNKHGREKYERRKRTNPTGFASLDQQRPAPLEGDMIKEEWFTILRPNELPFDMNRVNWDAWIDGAWTKKESDKKKKANDPDDTAVSYVYFDKKNKNLYIRGIFGVKKEISELIPFLDGSAKLNGIGTKSKVYIEMKASGWAISPELQKRGYNCVRIPNKLVAISKYNMVELCEPSFASGRIFFIQERGSNWIPSVIAQCTSFPNGAHDDKVDVITYPTLHYLVKPRDRAKTNYRN